MESMTVSPAEVLKTSKTIAVVGASKSPEKDAHTVPLYLIENGYRIIPINPTSDQVFGEKAYPSLLEIPDSVAREVDAVQVFRPSSELPQVARQTVQMKERSGKTPVFWAQAGLENEEAKEILQKGGIPYVMNACMRVVHTTFVKKRG